MNNTTVELYDKIKPSPANDDEDVCIMVADWGFKAGNPNLDCLWIIEDGAWFPINDPGCFICWLKGPIMIASQNEQPMVIDDSVKMLLLSIINHKTDNNFPDELMFCEVPVLLDWIIDDSVHGHGDDSDGI